MNHGRPSGRPFSFLGGGLGRFQTFSRAPSLRPAFPRRVRRLRGRASPRRRSRPFFPPRMPLGLSRIPIIRRASCSVRRDRRSVVASAWCPSAPPVAHSIGVRRLRRRASRAGGPFFPSRMPLGPLHIALTVAHPAPPGCACLHPLHPPFPRHIQFRISLIPFLPRALSYATHAPACTSPWSVARST